MALVGLESSKFDQVSKSKNKTNSNRGKEKIKNLSRNSTDINLPRFGHQKGPLVFRGLERSLGLENLAYIVDVENSINLGVQWAKPLEKILQTNLTFFFQELERQ